MIRIARQEDIERVTELLAHIGLNAADVLAPGTEYWLAERDGATVGVIGLEYSDGAALLRSAGVLPEARGGLGRALTRAALSAAARRGLKQVYLFSTDAGAFWARLGFREVPVPELVAALPNAPQVRQYDRMGWLPDEVAWRYDLEVV